MAAKNLVIVESPGKIQTISKVLGSDFTVMASMGHVRDLPKTKMGIDVKHNFEPSYLVSKDKKKVVDGLKTKIGPKTVVYIATDEDREGEAIGWHLVEALHLGERKDLKRIVFHEITKPAILEAVAHPRSINKKLVDAQQARRILDRLVGYELSPLLWKKIKYGLSAGRVQSVAVRLVVEREREIQAFKAQEYWSLIAELSTEKKKELFEAKLTKHKGKAIELKTEKETQAVLKDLEGAHFVVKNVEAKEVNRNPAAPFTTSTLQQEASRKLGFSVKKTMMVAQHLYEGVELDSGHEGLITYMRTDSVNLSPLALAQAKEVVAAHFGKEFALPEPRYYKGKKGAQEAHEAIRPSDLSRRPETLEKHLSKDELKLYELIWKRTLACQMAAAVLEQVGADIEAKDYIFRATGQTVKFPGFMQVYMEGHDEEEENEDGEKHLPVLTVGEKPALKRYVPEQHFTKPPARYTEASLVKKLESEGIGRPSTYAPTISTVQTRGYIQSEKKQLSPTEIGFLVNDFLVEHFPQILDYHFTVKMEDMLDQIEEGHEKWQSEIREFYEPFHELVDEKMKTIKKEDVITEKTDEICELCGKPMAVKFGRFGKFLSCTNFPECKNAKPLEGEGAQTPDPEKEKNLDELRKKFAGKKCPKCGKPMEVKTGRFGDYLACTDYPTCKGTESILKSIGVKCPECKEGELVERHTKRGGKAFYGCNRFPKCKFALWEKPSSSEHAAELKAAAEEKAEAQKD
ncbi:type I DNA topoisomerase [Candidatus Peregrinibacteria bacterium]|nr:MAG: type I DNA topoisomerase [Candidatus Peregrinibacteria bacterium]